VYFALLPYVHEVDDADNDGKINQQNFVSFSVIGVIRELSSPRLEYW